jgi:uncharacterized Zn finger protein (UPF0148 family)
MNVVSWEQRMTQRTCQDCPAPIIGRALRCPTCMDTLRAKRKSERAKRRYAEKKREAAAGAAVVMST